MKQNKKTIYARALEYILPIAASLAVLAIIIGGIIMGVQGVKKIALFLSLAIAEKQALEKQIAGLESQKQILAFNLAQCQTSPETSLNDSGPRLETVSSASTIGFAFGSGWGTLFINKGSSHEINKDDWVVTPDYTLIGKIETIYKNYSVVRTIFDSRTKIAAMITPSAAEGLFVVYNGSFLLDLVPLDVSSSTDAIVYTSGNDGLFPRGLVLGTIAGTAISPHPSLQTLIVRPIWHPGRTQNVLVINNIFNQ
jgi:rod shape-determining protein MreC